MPTIEDFRSKLQTLLAQAEASGASHLEISSRELHIEVGGYSGPPHRMPTCCDAMYGEMKLGDRIVSAPPKGKGATVVIRFALPR
jgi:hypothetical protein